MVNSQIVFLTANGIEKHPEVIGQITQYQMFELAPEVEFVQLERGKKAVFMANGQLQQTSTVRTLTKTEKGIYFATDYADYVQCLVPWKYGA